MIIGTTYSHRFAQFLQLDPIQSLHAIIALKFDIIRLACYWDEIQKDSKTYDFSTIKQLLDICEKNNQKVILTVGMKAPRYPEFYIPSFLQSNNPQKVLPECLLFIEKTIRELDGYSCIHYWQVENEPLDEVWPLKQCIEIDDLKKEIDLVRILDSKRKIIVNFWGNSNNVEETIKLTVSLTDIVGLDIYYRQFLRKIIGRAQYCGPSLSDNSFKNLCELSSKPIWITELQAEPWESGPIAYKQDKTKSMSPEILKNNFLKAKALNPKAILFWGSEYWLWRKQKGDVSYLKTVSDILRKD